MLVINPTQVNAHVQIVMPDGKFDTVHVMPQSRVKLPPGAEVTLRARQQYPRLQVRLAAVSA